MRVLLDTNVVLDVLLNREPWVTDAAKIWGLCSQRRVEGYLCASSITDIFYIARRFSDLTRARTAVQLCLTTFLVCAVDSSTLTMADKMPGHDFEDNLLIACAIVSNLDAIITRDSAGFPQSHVSVITPGNFLRQFPTSDFSSP